MITLLALDAEPRSLMSDHGINANHYIAPGNDQAIEGMAWQERELPRPAQNLTLTAAQLNQRLEGDERIVGSSTPYKAKGWSTHPLTYLALAIVQAAMNPMCQ